MIRQNSAFTLYILYLIGQLQCTWYGIKWRMTNREMKNCIVIFFGVAVLTSLFLALSPILYLIYAISVMLLLKLKMRSVNSATKYNSNFSVINSNVKNVITINRMNCSRNKKDLCIVTGDWQGSRPYMEDRFCVLRDAKRDIFSIFDGHGGSDMAEYLSSHLMKRYQLMRNYGSITDVLYSTLCSLDSSAKRAKISAGSTGVVVSVDSECITCAWVGDSVAKVVDKMGAIHDMTEPHAFSNYSEYCRYVVTTQTDKNPNHVKKLNVMRSKTGLMTTRTIGDFKHRRKDPGIICEPQVKQYKPTSSKTKWEIIIIGSDGIFDVMTVKTMIDEMIDAKILIASNRNTKTKYDFSKSKTERFMRRLQFLTTRKATLFDKLSSVYTGDNCSILIITRNAIYDTWSATETDRFI